MRISALTSRFSRCCEPFHLVHCTILMQSEMQMHGVFVASESHALALRLKFASMLHLCMLHSIGGEQSGLELSAADGSLKGAPNLAWTLSTPYTAAMNLLKPPVKSTWGQGFVPPAWRVNRACPCMHIRMTVSDYDVWHNQGAAALRSRCVCHLPGTGRGHSPALHSSCL